MNEAEACSDVRRLAREVLTDAAVRALREEREKLQDALRWALEHTHYRVSRGREESDRCLYCKQILQLIPNQGHGADCPYARVLKLLEEKP